MYRYLRFPEKKITLELTWFFSISWYVMLEILEKSPFYTGGLNFSCKRCSACCRFESGYVFLSWKDVCLLGTALNMEFKDFIKTYCRWIPSVNGDHQLSLKEKSNYDCIFWNSKLDTVVDGGCSIYDSRPLQCRAFPFWTSILCDEKSWETSAHSCPGMGSGAHHSRDSIEKWLALRLNEPIMSKGEF